MLLHRITELAAVAAPGRTALVDGGRRWTFAELSDRVAAAARGVAALTSPGDRAVVVADNRAEFVTALLAVPAAGAVLAPGNTRHTPDELAAMIDRCGATVVVADAAQLVRLGPSAPHLQAVRHWVALDPPPGGTPEPAGTLRWHDLPALGEGVVLPPVADDDPAWLIHTSGTTGRAKGAVLTHRSLLAGATNTALGRGVRDDEVYLFPFPLFHVAAYNVVVHHLCRRPVVLLPRFDAAAVLAAIERERVTSVSLAPTMLAMLLDRPDRLDHDLSSLRQVSYGASAMPLDLLRRTLAELPGVGLAQGYGMTELSGNAVFLGPEEHRRAATGEPHLLAAAGRPGPLAAVRVVGADGRPAPAGGTGEIQVRGDQAFAGYWQDPEATAAAFDGPWLRTGDVGRLDDEGHLYVVDRLKDIIITGGENVASREVEDLLSTHPDVAAVAVVGEPDDRWGELVVAVVVWRDGAAGTDRERADALVEWTRDRIAGFKRPRRVRSVASLPTNPSGKVDKRRLREPGAA